MNGSGAQSPGGIAGCALRPSGAFARTWEHPLGIRPFSTMDGRAAFLWEQAKSYDRADSRPPARSCRARDPGMASTHPPLWIDPLT